VWLVTWSVWLRTIMAVQSSRDGAEYKCVCTYLTCKALDLEGGGHHGPQLELHGGVAPHCEVGEGGGRQQRQISQPLPLLRDRLMQLLLTYLPAAPAPAAYARSRSTLVRA
jgi:hypothetical protein